MTEDITRRETIKLLAFGAGFAAGAISQTDDEDTGTLPIAGGEETYTEQLATRLYIGSGYEALKDVADAGDTALGLDTENGNWWLFGDKKARSRIDDVLFLLGHDGYEEAKAAANERPAIAFTTTGNKWVFT